ncbi:hypothetical protein FE810_08070 [Thalassotalea litorea]|uniref:Glycogen debranching enzyme C-terminal domain-containing protein n=1 Tax=Thalassotalea litorea TaxID=2020715 RepID=A0A5R9IIX2_9GAMM|nr:amylo-alpha-1,6-glucosidase [Thalassotalea litorea]TLU65242.1 hypothetical protein FE810_08070 [Thalassotalea litorea]
MFYRFSLYLTVIALIIGCQPTSTMKPHQTASSEKPQVAPQISLDSLAIHVSASENRPVSFTNKRSGYYYTQTHNNDHPEHRWFAGFNLAQKRLFNDYQITLDSDSVNRQQANVTVYPDKLVRQYPNGTVEQLSLFDDQDIVRISISTDAQQVALTLTGAQITQTRQHAEMTLYRSDEAPQKLIAVAPIVLPKDAKSREKGFYVLIGDNIETLSATLKSARENDERWQQQRQQRMLTLLTGNAYLQSRDVDLVKAIQWQILNLDSLMTNQHGKGIYAGLPWFNEYWGRDSFIALPGATLVTGQFEFARDMITAFAKFQDRDPESKFFGRVPNRVRIEDIDYHTTDGTPRFVIEMLHYVQYSGDTTLIKRLYPNVKDSIDGALRNWVDSKGYLLHADNETWMDARREPDKVPYSPRGTRANDIQALWFEQLNAGIYFAEVMNDKASRLRWQQARDKLQSNFTQDFILDDLGYLVDHLNQDGSADTQLRPNQLYAFDMIEDSRFVSNATKTSWQQLVYPWGVASLDNRDIDFHPFHLTEKYHKDAAYHNGTVWLWNNGIAMQRMIEVGGPDIAYQLFSNMNEQALHRGVVGGLAENADAYPHQLQTLPTITGTYLQAWSNAEHLRVWYQYFLGVRPDLIKQEITFAPRIPSLLSDIDFQVRVGDTQLNGSFQRSGATASYRIEIESFRGALLLDLPSFPVTKIDLQDCRYITIEQTTDSIQIIKVDDNESKLQEIRLTTDNERLKTIQRQQQTLFETRFSSPLSLENHRVLN